MSRCTLDTALSVFLSLTGLSPSPAGFPKTFLLESLNQLCGPNPAVHAQRFGLFPFRSPLLWKSMFLSLPPATKMFQFPALAFHIVEWYLFKVPGCPIRKSADQRLFAPTRSLSQLITSFIASESQGIRHVPLLTFCLTDHVWSIYTFSF